MARIFSVLAVLAVLSLVTNFLVGMTAGDFNAAAQHKRETQHRLIELERQAKGRNAPSAAELVEARQAAEDADAAFRSPRGRMTLHMLLGCAAALLTVLVNSITITYFIGTSRWCKEVCETYGIERELAEHSTHLKRSTFPWALVGIVAVIAVVGLGAAADPSGANARRAAGFVQLHYLAAMLGIALVIAAFWMQIVRIAENYAVIEKIVAEVQRIRAAKNLPVESSVP